MGKENSILTIDIGTRNLRMAEFVIQENGILLTQFLSRPIELAEGQSIGEWFDINYNEMLIEGAFISNSVRLALPAGNSFQRLSKLPPMLGNAETVARIIEFEASQAVPYAMHEVEWGYQLLHHKWEDKTEETKEDGTVEEVSIENEEYEALFVAVKREEVTCFTDVIDRSGKKLLSVELASLNVFNAAVVSQINDEDCTMILEIGAKSSCLMLADHRRIFMRNIPIGGDTINAQISKEFSVGDQEAEDLKRRYGFVALGGAYDEPESAFASTISKIARNVMTRLHGEISRSINLWRAHHNGNAPVKVLLAGGASTMQYTVEFFEEKLRLPVEYLNSFGLISIAETADRGRLQASASMAQSMIGMALHSLGSCPVDISLLPREIKKQYELDARKSYFYASAIALIGCLLISMVGIGQVRDFEKERVEKVEAQVAVAEKEVASVNSLVGQLNSMRDNYDQSKKFLDARDQYTRVLRELQEAMPDRMWLVTLEPYEEEEEDYSDDTMMGGSSNSNTEKINSEDPNSRISPEKFNAMREIKQLRLVGYVLRLGRLDEDQNLLLKFEENIKNKSTLFETENIRYVDTVDNNSNLTYFEFILTLKEAVKK